ncbi:MAG: nucleoside-diphosphate sugar epimerase/dehydratase [Candidatus Dormiibacterota bacterium]
MSTVKDATAEEGREIRQSDVAAPPSPPTQRAGLIYLLDGLRIHGFDWFVEVIILNVAFALAFLVRYGGRIPSEYVGVRSLLSIGVITATYTASVLVFRSYRIVWRFASVRDMVQLALTVATCVLLIAVVELGPLRANRPIPLSALAIGGSLGYLAIGQLMGLSRLQTAVPRRTWGEPLVIFGAGSAGVALFHQLQEERGRYRPVAFLDDDRRKIGRDVAGLRVLGSRDDIAAILKRSSAQNLAIAVPSLTPDQIRVLSRMGSMGGARVLVMPSMHELLTGSAGRLPLRDVAMEDLTDRAEVAVDIEALRAGFQGKRILVTGAAGSIGSELVRQIRSLDPVSITMFDNNESGLTDLRDALGPTGTALHLRLGTVQDEAGIHRVFDEMHPQVVIHAAALKHVDLLESQPHEAVRVNVLGTWICANAAEQAAVETFVLISSDKAVDPVGVLGASKRLGELMMASLRDSKTLFTAVRFGNVIGSRGSVLPRFEQQITRGGPLTVTHPDVYRYFMSVDEAVRLVLQSAVIARPGCIYVLDMGEDVPIVKVATRLAQLHGLRVPEDIEIVFTGLRPGERMQEALVGASESPASTEHPKVSEIARNRIINREDLASLVALLQSLANESEPEIVRRRLIESACS